jgi:arginine decarboxylase
MLHYHQGSQLPGIESICVAVKEAVSLYAELQRAGASMGLLNIGGGLAVDYDGSGISQEGSRGYSVGEYCYRVTKAISDSVRHLGIEAPDLVSEAGRAVVSHCSMLVFEVNGSAISPLPQSPPAVPDGMPEDVREIFRIAHRLNSGNLKESLDEASYHLGNLRILLRGGRLPLSAMAAAERAVRDLERRVLQRARESGAPASLAMIEKHLSELYQGNFSIFQSMPDSWAIGQVFPVMPIQRLNETPTCNARIKDLTCDSDGVLSRFSDCMDERFSTPLHAPRDGEPYYVGAFLIGAYQEILGDRHNLFGSTHIASVELGNDDIEIEIYPGESTSDVLGQVGYSAPMLHRKFCETLGKATKERRLTPDAARRAALSYRQVIKGYPYLS